MNKFWLGFTIAVCYQGLVEDLLGKERYIQVVRDAWIDEPAWFWVVLALVVIALNVANDRLGRKSNGERRR